MATTAVACIIDLSLLLSLSVRELIPRDLPLPCISRTQSLPSQQESSLNGSLVWQVSFPPEAGYEFGSNETPFLLLHVQGVEQNPTGNQMVLKRGGVYARITILQKDSGQERTIADIWSPNGVRIHLHSARQPGDNLSVCKVITLLHLEDEEEPILALTLESEWVAHSTTFCQAIRTCDDLTGSEFLLQRFYSQPVLRAK